MKTVGIIGGMGPLATADLFRKTVMNTKASCDQEHIHLIIDNNTNIADRTAALLHGGADPYPEMKKSALLLKEAGADLLMIPCNTAHAYYERLSTEVSIPILHMPEVCCRVLKEKGVRKAGLLSTTGTVQTGIYQKAASKHGIELLIPDDEGQRYVMSVIYNGVKAGKRDYDTTIYEKTVQSLFDLGAETMILGCTELPVAMEMYGLDFACIDPTLELAREAIRLAGGETV